MRGRDTHREMDGGRASVRARAWEAEGVEGSESAQERARKRERVNEARAHASSC